MRIRRFLIIAILMLGLFTCSLLSLRAEDKKNDDTFGPKVIFINEVEPGDVLGDMFNPVFFRHKYHAKIVKDCTICHHFFDEHYNDQIVPSSRCEGCHLSKNFKSMGRHFACRVCHEPDATPEIRNVRLSNGTLVMIPGLKAAYHRHCIECHREMNGPVGCGDCHLARVPDHSSFIKEYKGAATCEECHPGKIAEVQNTIHYRLNKSYSFKKAAGFSEESVVGELGMISSVSRLFGIDAISAWNVNSDKACKNCHIGCGEIPFSGKGEMEPSESELNNVDCLICHVDQGYSLKIKQQYSKDFARLGEIAKKVSTTKSTSCLRCHTGLTSIAPSNAVSSEYSGLRGTSFESGKDVHASLGMTCFDCHYSRDHMFKRQISTFVQAGDFQLSEQGCARCHRDVHVDDENMKMTTIMSCTGCHVPDQGGPIEVNLMDRSKPTNLKSRFVYRWFNRTIDIDNIPHGNKNDSLLYPFRVAIIKEPLDDKGDLIPVDIVTGAPKSSNISKWREREVYIPLSHGVHSKGAYTCSDCHSKTSKFNWESMGIKIKIFK